MKRVQLVFPQAADVWNFLELTKMPKVEVHDTVIQGFFSESEIAQAINNYGAAVQDYIAPAVQAPAKQKAASSASSSTGEAIQLQGKSGVLYKGMLYTKGHGLQELPAQAIIGLSNSVYTNGAWQHAVNAFYRTSRVQEELERFEERDDILHLIVIPVDAAQPDAIDDLVMNYIHQ